MIPEKTTVLITGGTGELGRVVAEEFVGQGMSVFLTARSGGDADLLPPALRASVRIFPADLTAEPEVRDLFRGVQDLTGEIGILLNCAGGYLSRRPVRETEVSDWKRILDLNLMTMYLCSREYIRNKDTSRYGRIISIAAMPALIPAEGTGAYAVSKGGVVTLTRVIGEELKHTAVTANAIAPGIIDTAPNRASMPDSDRSGWVRPAAIAQTMLFLCSENARSVNGHCIEMFGGL